MPPRTTGSDASRQHARPDADGVARARSTTPRCPRLHTDTLFGEAHEIEIQHGEAVYRLRITSLGKLILTK